ncbi:aminotransferase class IV [Nakamurella leprariae]|uniref:Aminotransferase class IV n=1 Tax=Nakamurella leprariae TaxID=2803911 RepID=A0A938YDU7_9ACTN|nr:aminotransferase class IV [Nakamurella leprariae]MBM9466612.1 aminotransferase class IV [Nakamurella leprariae]
MDGTESAPTMLVALLDGTVLPGDAPLLRPDDSGVLRGDGVFETTLAVDGVARDVDEHLRRLAGSAAALRLTLPGPGAWRTGIDAALAAVPAGSADGGADGGVDGGADWSQTLVRLVATRGAPGAGPTCFVTVGPVPDGVRAQRRGVRVLTLDRGIGGGDAAAVPWLLAGAKTLSYAVNMAAVRHAVAQGADDAVFVAPDGAVLEAPTATVVLAWERSLVTPPVDGILAGITVRRLFAAAEAAGWSTGSQVVPSADLHAADGMWLVSSARLLAPVTAVDGADRDSDRQRALTVELAALLQVPTG